MRFHSSVRTASKIAVAAGVAALAIPIYPHETITTTVSYDREIVRVINKKCIMCHSADNLGPPLTTYEETRPWARDIEEQVLQRHMPIWSAVSGYGHFSNDIGLTLREIQFIVSWVEGNGPKSKDQQGIENFGEGAVAPKLALTGLQWKKGKPDAIVSVPAESLELGDTMLVRHVTIDPHLTAEKMVRSIEFEPDDHRVLRAASFSVKETGQWLGSWTPWAPVTTLPENTAFRLPAGSHIIAELHFEAPNESVKSGGSLGLHFTATAARHPSDVILETKREGTADMPSYRCATRIATESQVLAFLPELPDGIDSFDVSARKPDGTATVLLLVRHAMPDWPMPYMLSEPVTLPANTELMLTAYPRAGQEMTGVRITVSLSAMTEHAR